jgi:hypothetical protein
MDLEQIENKMSCGQSRDFMAARAQAGGVIG